MIFLGLQARGITQYANKIYILKVDIPFKQFWIHLYIYFSHSKPHVPKRDKSAVNWKEIM
jgi:hypothetical protein